MPQLPRILVIRRRYLGDVVLLGSLFRNLRLHWPGTHIAALVEPSYSGILALNPDVDAVMAPPSGAAAWPRFDSSSQQMLSLVAPHPHVQTSFAAEHHCAFWAR